MKILVLGGDGFCGWPTALHLSAIGHDIVIVDNLARRNIDNELEVQSLTQSAHQASGALPGRRSAAAPSASSGWTWPPSTTGCWR
jgi:nucleoside-diphosphate-sugar epimerase